MNVLRLGQRCRRFFTIKNDKGYYIDYTHHSRWTPKICNARLFNSERGAIDEAQRMLKHKKKQRSNFLKNPEISL